METLVIKSQGELFEGSGQFISQIKIDFLKAVTAAQLQLTMTDDDTLILTDGATFDQNSSNSIETNDYRNVENNNTKNIVKGISITSTGPFSLIIKNGMNTVYSLNGRGTAYPYQSGNFPLLKEGSTNMQYNIDSSDFEFGNIISTGLGFITNSQGDVSPSSLRILDGDSNGYKERVGVDISNSPHLRQFQGVSVSKGTLFKDTSEYGNNQSRVGYIKILYLKLEKSAIIPNFLGNQTFKVKDAIYCAASYVTQSHAELICDMIYQNLVNTQRTTNVFGGSGFQFTLTVYDVGAGKELSSSLKTSYKRLYDHLVSIGYNVSGSITLTDEANDRKYTTDDIAKW